MNILIKNADFSAVSIGRAGVVNALSVLTNVYLAPAGAGVEAGIGFASGNQILCYDVSSMSGKTVKITGYRSQWYGYLARFYSGDAITEDTSYASDDMSALNSHFGAPIQTLTATEEGIHTIIIEVPTGAKSLCVYGAGDHAEECSLVELA